jgi:hypothetical protein
MMVVLTHLPLLFQFNLISLFDYYLKNYFHVHHIPLSPRPFLFLSQMVTTLSSKSVHV